jgi:hypothetical protein
MAGSATWYQRIDVKSLTRQSVERGHRWLPIAGSLPSGGEVSFMNGSRKITVRLPAKEFSFEESVEILRSVLSRGGCPRCYSGVDISFINEVELIVNENGEVGPRGFTAE